MDRPSNIKNRPTTQDNNKKSTDRQRTTTNQQQQKTMSTTATMTQQSTSSSLRGEKNPILFCTYRQMNRYCNGGLQFDCIHQCYWQNGLIL
jgi:hypothetical protein